MAIEPLILIPLGVSVGTLILSFYMTRNKVSFDYIASLEKRVTECEQGRRDLQKQLVEQDRENIRLLRQMMVDLSKPNVTVNTTKEVIE